jgi:hypothetical protein
MGTPEIFAARPARNRKLVSGSARVVFNRPSAVAVRYWQATPFTANEVGAVLVVLFQVPLKPIPE